MTWRGLATLVVAFVPTTVAFLGLLGVGLHRQASPFAVSATATLVVFGPGLAAAWVARRERLVIFGLVDLAWSAVLLLQVLPVWFPGERREAVAAGIAVLGLGQFDGLARSLADQLPAEPVVARPRAPEAAAMVTVVPPPLAPAADQIALPFEGEGRTLAVPVVVEHGGSSLEIYMMLDTGATYTTLPMDVLGRLGAEPGPGDPSIELHTANGDRQAHLVLLDRIWLGDQAVEGVAVATCDRCASSDTVGLLGLNVAGGFNVTIDADRREMLFQRRLALDRVLDVKPFVHLDASFVRFPGGRVEVEVRLDNPRQRHVQDVVAGIRCGDRSWTVPVGSVPPVGRLSATRRLPAHDTCATYEVDLVGGRW